METHKIFQAFNPETETEKITKAIRKFFDERPFLARKAVIGLSGGIDSSVACTLLVRAIGKGNVFCLKMPSSTSSKESSEDADKTIVFNEIPASNFFTKDLSAYENIFKKLEEPNDLRRGNFCARMRMIYLFDFATKINGIVCGTENLSENYLGYFTICGDQGSIFEPIEHLFKTEVRVLAQFLKIPEKIIEKPPTADLWQAQTDEAELGFTYREADIVLKIWEKTEKPETLSVAGIPQETVQKVLKRVKNSAYKLELPYTVAKILG
ncbi:NAD(+) synthase [bacterium]|nr:NAD(+) synthase [bacterium]